MTDKVIFSTTPIDNESREPDAQLARLTAKWRRDRSLDDSHANMLMSTTAVLREHPKLAKEYSAQPFNAAKFGAEYFDKVELVRS